jgi:hypothetical protein
MNTPVCWIWSLLSLLVILPVTGCMQRQASQTDVSATTPPAVDPDAIAAAQTEEPADLESVPEPELADGAVTGQPAERLIPANIRPGSPLAEAIKLASSGLDEGVLLAFVTNSTGTFNLGAEEIIYLNDIGVHGNVISAMIQRDHMLQQIPTESLLAQVVASPAEQIQPMPEQTLVPPLETGEEVVPGAYPAPPEPAEGDYSDFYQDLAPYGNWVDVAGYGQCWQPTVVVANPGWRPYCDRGHWIYTDCGWYWASDYSWGWAPFHYGRWFRHEHLGWCWTPDKVWGPAWVSWRYSHDYCGWAPLPPAACYVPGTGFTYHGRLVGVAFNFGIGAASFTFVPVGSMTDSHLAHNAVPREQVHNLYHQTVSLTRITTSNNHLVNHGVPPEQVVAVTHHPVRRAIVRQTTVVAQGARPEQVAADGATVTVYQGRSGALERQSVGASEHGIARPVMASVHSASSPGTPFAATAVSSDVTSPTRGLRERVPPNSLVVIGRHDGNHQRTAAVPTAMAYQQSASHADEHVGSTSYAHNGQPAASATPYYRQVARAEHPIHQEPVPQFETRVNPSPVRQAAPEPRQIAPPSFQPLPEPRAAQPPAQAVEHHHAPPPVQVEARPAAPPPPPPAVSQPAAPPASHDHSSVGRR